MLPRTDLWPIKGARARLRFPPCSDRMVNVMKTEAIGGDWVGQVIDGKFTLLQWLGGSDTNGVFLTQIEGDRPQRAAIRLIPAGAIGADAQIAHWRAAASLSHPHLMRLFDTGSCHVGGNRFFYSVTEYAEENLSEILPERPLTAAETSEMLGPVLDALGYLHAKGFVHGHLKPSNILVVNDQLKLSSDNIQPAGKPGKRHQTLDIHDAPEYAAGTISPAVDIWSLGVTLVEALTQRPPVWDRAKQSDPVVPESLPEPFAGIAREALRTDPARRCALGEIGDRLKGTYTPQNSPAIPANTAPPARSRLPLVVAAVVVAMVLIVFFLIRSHQSEPPQATVDQQNEPAIAKPSASSPAPEKQNSKPALVESQPLGEPPIESPTPSQGGSKREAANDAAIVEQALPDVLPKAVASIHGQFVVKVRVSVDAAGSVTDVAFDSPGPSRYFANAALNASRRWRFKPAVVNGQPVTSAWLLQFRFTREGTEVTPVKVAP